MGCHCNYDYNFDKGDYENWCEFGFSLLPHEGAKCCECGAELPINRLRHAFVFFEVYEPTESLPPHPDDSYDIDAISDEEYHRLELIYDAAANRLGWDDEYGRFERAVDSQWRCDRCEVEVEIMEAFGYCANMPGDLPTCHAEFVLGRRRRHIVWKPDKNGILHPRRFTLKDHARRIWRGRHGKIWVLRTRYWRLKYHLRNNTPMRAMKNLFKIKGAKP